MVRWYIEVGVLVVAAFLLGAMLMAFVLARILPDASRVEQPKPASPGEGAP